jgi:hypothetical protein
MWGRSQGQTREPTLLGIGYNLCYIWWLASRLGRCARYGGTSPNLTGVCFIYCFWFLVISPHWAFQGCHVAPSDWAKWNPWIGPLGYPIMMMSPPCQLRTGHVAPSEWCHVVSPGGATWHFSTGPNGAPKILLVGDMW